MNTIPWKWSTLIEVQIGGVVGDESDEWGNWNVLRVEANKASQQDPKL